jgi:hypothetical protein
LEPRQQILTGLVLGLLFIGLGVWRGFQRGRLRVSEKLDYGYVLKLIFLSLAVAAAIVNVILTLIFIVAWAVHVDPPGAPQASLDSFLPVGYAVHYVMGIVAAGALCIFALAVIGYLDHVNTG